MQNVFIYKNCKSYDIFIIKGMYITGWNEDMKAYNDWICEEWGMTSD